MPISLSTLKIEREDWNLHHSSHGLGNLCGSTATVSIFAILSVTLAALKITQKTKFPNKAPRFSA